MTAPTYTDDDDTMGAVRALLEPLFLALEPSLKYKKQRNAGLAKDVPCVIVSRAGGDSLDSYQDTLRDFPILVIDVFTDDIDTAHIYATRVEKIMRRLGAKRLTSQTPIPNAAESAVVRGVSVSFQINIR